MSILVYHLVIDGFKNESITNKLKNEDEDYLIIDGIGHNLQYELWAAG